MPALNLEERMEILPGVDPRRIIHEMPWSIPDELVATDIAREWLRRWALAGCPEADPADALCMGDIAVAELVVTALERIPPPVVHHVVKRCLIMGAGRTNGGWADGTTTELDAPKIFIAIVGAGDEETVLTLIGHECSHAWLHASDELAPPWLPLVRKGNEERLVAAIQEMGISGQPGTADILKQRREKYDHVKNRRELEACALTRAWRFTGRGAYHNRRRFR